MEAINVNAEPGKDRVTEGRGQPVRRDRGPDLSCQHEKNVSQTSNGRKVKKIKYDVDFRQRFY